MIRSLAFIAAALAAIPAHAINHSCSTGRCNHVVAHEVVAAAPQYVTQNFFYSVGDAVRYPIVTPQAVAQAEQGQLVREMQRLQDKFTDIKQQQAYQPQIICVPYPPQQAQQLAAYCQPGMPKPAPAAESPAERPTFNLQTKSSVIEAKCMKCHRGANAKGDLDFEKPITCDQFKASMSRLMTDDQSMRMPKGQPPLSPEETAAAIKELLTMVEQSQ